MSETEPPIELVDPYDYLKTQVETYANREKRVLKPEEYLFRTPLKPPPRFPNRASLKQFLLQENGWQGDPRFESNAAYPCVHCGATGSVTDGNGRSTSCLFPGCNEGVLPPWSFMSLFLQEQHKYKLEVKRWRTEVEFYRLLKQKLSPEERRYLRIGH